MKQWSVYRSRRPSGEGHAIAMRHPFAAVKIDVHAALRLGYRAIDLGQGLYQNGPVLAAGLVCIGYFLGAKLGFALTFHPQPVSVLWPPNAILLAALLLTPMRWWWLMFAAAFPAHWAAQWQSQVPPPMMLCWFLSNSFEALIGAWSIRALSKPQFRFDTFRAVAVFIACGVFMGPFVSSFLDAAFVVMNGWGASSYWQVWQTRFLSNAMAAMTLVTVIISWTTVRLSIIRQASALRVAEGALLMFAVLLLGFLIFVFPDAGPGRRPVLLYAPLPFLLWAGVRFGFTGLTTSLLAVVLIAIWGTAHGQGPFSSRSPHENALSLQLFLVVVSIPLLCLSALIQERRKTEEALRRSEARYREVIETQTDMICRFLPDTTLTFVNDALCRFFGRKPHEMIGRRFVEFLPESARRGILDKFAMLAGNPRVEIIEGEVLRADGTVAWNHWVNHPIPGSDGRVGEFQGIGHDITDRKRAEAANEKLTQVSRLAIVGELTASIVHEISQPLGAILTNAEAAEIFLDADPGNVEHLRAILADIRKDDERANEVIRHIRNLLQKRLVHFEALDLNVVVKETLGFIGIEARRRGITLQTDLAHDVQKVKGDLIQLQQVLLNLVLNAMDAMIKTPKTQRRLKISTRLDASRGDIHLLVSDTGTGIAPDHLPKLFASFFTTKENGMGLGLSISRAILEAHQGRIWGENNKGRGATFGFALPSMQPAQSGDSEKALCQRCQS